MTSLPLALFFNVSYIRARFCFALSGGNLTAQSTGSHWESGGGILILETWLRALIPFPAMLPDRPGELARRLLKAPRVTRHKEDG